jgi:succinate dehydrogenase flavin-adding protein (antitoxin of CptAB toxin-antitoxin module)
MYDVCCTYLLRVVFSRNKEDTPNKYYNDLAVLKKEYRAAQDNFRDMVNNEFNRLNEWASNYSQANTKEQNDHLEAVRNDFQKTISDIKEELTKLIQSGDNNLSNWITNHAEAHRRDKQSTSC